MSVVRELGTDDLSACVDIVANAYPGIKINTAEDRSRHRERLQARLEGDNTGPLYGCFRDQKLLGVMRLFDWTVNLNNCLQPAGGVGLVAVDLLHKRQHVAKDLIAYFIRHYHERGAAWTMLYPFRPDFYRRMGFGYGAKLNMYRIAPASFPRSMAQYDVATVGAEDATAVAACYNRFAERTHGMIVRAASDFENTLGGENRVVAVLRDGEVRGYVVFGFKPRQADNFLTNNLQIHELIYEDTAALRALLDWVNRQSDQFGEVILNSHDDYLHHLLFDPRNGSENLVLLHHETNAQGVGLMYRVVDLPAAFRAWSERDFGGQSCRVRFDVVDSFYEPNNGSTLVWFDAGRARVLESGTPDVALRIDVGDLSSLLVGAVPFAALDTYGLVEVSDRSFVPTMERLFHAPKPVCMTRF